MNVIGAMLSSGNLALAKLWKNVSGLWFFGFLMALIEQVGKPMVVILDNASIHKAKKLKPYWDLLEAKGIQFYFLPSYGYQLKAGQFKVKPFVVSLSNHERPNRPPFDRLRANGYASQMSRFKLLAPSYSPELNRIELLWRKMKYEWLPFKTFTPDELEQAIDEIGSGFGSKYTLTFC